MNRDIKLLFALFTLSGFTGLIYESVWSHYLRLFLGAAAFSQSFVLAAFMGGMALGAWLASRWSARFANLLAAYGWIEAAIGVAALLFHELFVLLTQASLDHVIPALGSPDAVEVYKYSLCALLIVPQTVLLGMTFPLLSGAVIRRGPQQSGHHLAMLYFTNSIGAAIGALASAFLLIGWIGMPGTMRLAGALNLALAAVVLAIAHRGEPAAVTPAAGTTTPAGTYIARLFLAGAFVTGLASFIYEIVWIRMLSLVLGSSFHAFELMLSAFITGLALGGLWIRRRIDRIADPVRFAGVVQVLMGLAALSTVFVYHWTFDWMAWALGVLQKSASAYPVFNLFSHGLAFAVMLPTTFFAGMTLPLFTHVLLRGGRGERAIGQVYAANTLGSIAGVLVAVHLLLPDAGLKLALVVGAAADMLLGAWILRYSLERFRRAHAFAALIAGMLAATATARLDILEPERLSSGVFRYGHALPEFGRVIFYRDGKTASVAARAQPGGIVSLSTNGKPDAAIRLDTDLPPTPDEYTMTLVAALPLLIKPDAKSLANVGWGSGLTTEVALSHRGPKEVDTIEIEPAMVTGAMAFAPRVLRPYQDRRSHVFFEDAKSYFARYGKRYDVIMAEPSNPWVNGVAGLFSTEFYRDTKRYLAPGGVFVQWLQVYEFSDELLASILGALRENFSDYEIYESNPGDLLVIAVVQGRVPRPGPLPVEERGFMEHMDRLGIAHIEEIAARSLGTMRQIDPLFAPFQAPVNSDFRPFVQLEAARARFEGSRAQGLMSLATAPLPIVEMIGGAPRSHLKAPVPDYVPALGIRRQSVAVEIARLLGDRAADPLRSPEKLAGEIALVLKYPGALCADQPSKTALEQLQLAAEVTLSSLDSRQARALWIERRWIGCTPRSAHVRDRLDVYAAVAARDSRAMLARARTLLAGSAAGGDPWGRYLLSTALLGAHAAGEHSQAGDLWQRYGRVLYPRGDLPPYLVYLANLK
ncbi:MAG TPA: fused MFS/spermidine synthase [Burkholderiales bacterium]|nr:fused MFS/spermidine synthase [Burkholderiales bacterium]